MTERPTTAAEALRAVAQWFDIHYPTDINTEIQDDLRKWATEIERTAVSEVSLKLDNEVLTRRLATRDKALADQELRMDCVLCWKHAETHKSSIPCHKCQEERIQELELRLASLAESGTGYSQETMDAVIQQRARLAQELEKQEQICNQLRSANDEAQKTINYLRQQITMAAAKESNDQRIVDALLKARTLSHSHKPTMEHIVTWTNLYGQHSQSFLTYEQASQFRDQLERSTDATNVLVLPATEEQ